jgi:uncharacterized membrane protein YtjA (UPF0391 family)
MLALALLFLVLAVVAHFMGAGKAGDTALDIAKILFFVFLALLVLSILLNLVSPGPYWMWPVPHSGVVVR